MEKEIKSETVFREQSKNPIPFKAINIPLLPDDIISAGYDEGCFEGDDQWDPHYFLEVERPRLETDEEFEERMQNDARSRKWLKEKRYETYLKLKKEFEDIDKP
jgi:hypothetical protein